MKRLLNLLIIMMLLHVTLNLQAQDFRNTIETGEGLPSFYPYLGFEWEGNENDFNNLGNLRFMGGARYYHGDNWNFEAEYGRDMVMKKTDFVKRRQILRLGAARMLFGSLKTKAVDDHYSSGKFLGVNLRGGVEYRVEQMNDIMLQNQEYYYIMNETFSYGLTSAYLGAELMLRKKRKSLDINYFRGVSVNKRGWNHHLYFDVFLLSFLSNNEIELYFY